MLNFHNFFVGVELIIEGFGECAWEGIERVGYGSNRHTNYVTFSGSERYLNEVTFLIPFEQCNIHFS
jgi:hypothetical protein